MPTLLVSHHACVEHDTGAFHPECADRLKSVLACLEREEFMLLHRAEAPEATREHLTRVHPLSYVEHILSCIPDEGHRHVDGDTVLSPASGEAMLRAAGAVVTAVDAVLSGEARNAFCAVRPPGHHAERHQAMGFCFFNNAAVGAFHARAAHGVKKVAVVDFDVHHGNGTQHIFWDDAGMFYASSHEWPSFPHTGTPSERGAHGNILNVPLISGSGSEPFRAAYSEKILPALKEFAPELIIISAGFDAHIADPLAGLRVRTEDYGWLTQEILKVAGEVCNNRVVSTLEGGYDLPALCSSVAVHVRALMGSYP